jgi:hypothetical protein
VYALLVLVTLHNIAAQPPTGRGSIAGCATQRLDATPVSGVTVVISGRGVRRSELTNSDGCYEAGGLPPGTYTLIARLQGFTGTAREVTVSDMAVTRVDFSMQPAAIVDFLDLTGPLSTYWADADAVVHLRVTGYQPGPLDGSIPTIGHKADVLHLLKRHPKGGPSGPTMTFLQQQLANELVPYEIGRELVVFLRWDSFLPQDSFVRLAGPMLVFTIENGRLQPGLSSVVNRYAGMPIEDFLTALRALASR